MFAIENEIEIEILIVEVIKMRMLVKYTAYVDFAQDGTELERNYYLSFVKKDDVIDIPFDSMETLQNQAGKYSIADYIKSPEFKKEAQAYDDYREFFAGVETLVLYEDSIAVDFSSLDS